MRPTFSVGDARRSWACWCDFVSAWCRSWGAPDKGVRRAPWRYATAAVGHKAAAWRLERALAAGALQARWQVDGRGSAVLGRRLTLLLCPRATLTLYANAAGAVIAFAFVDKVGKVDWYDGQGFAQRAQANR